MTQRTRTSSMRPVPLWRRVAAALFGATEVLLAVTGEPLLGALLLIVPLALCAARIPQLVRQDHRWGPEDGTAGVAR